VFVSFETKHGVVFATWSRDHDDAIFPSEIEIEHLKRFNLDHLTHSVVIDPLRTNTATPMFRHKVLKVD